MARASGALLSGGRSRSAEGGEGVRVLKAIVARASGAPLWAVVLCARARPEQSRRECAAELFYLLPKIVSPNTDVAEHICHASTN